MSAVIHTPATLDLRRTAYVGGVGSRSLTIADIKLTSSASQRKHARWIRENCGLQARRQRSASANLFQVSSLLSPRVPGTASIRPWSNVMPAERAERTLLRGGETQTAAAAPPQLPNVPHHNSITRRSTVQNVMETEPKLRRLQSVNTNMVGQTRNHSLRQNAKNVLTGVAFTRLNGNHANKQNNAAGKILRRRTTNNLRKAVPNGFTAGEEGGDGTIPPGANTKTRHSWINPEEIRKTKNSRFKEAGEAREFLRHMTRLFMICLRWVAILENRDDSLEYQIKTFTDLTIELEEEEETRDFTQEAGLAFDKNYFKVKKEITLSSEVQRILTTHPRARTKDSIQQAQRGLQTLESFAEYPLHMQEKFCKIAWLQTYPPKKVIVREGHEAENFYFLLSGQAILRKGIRDEMTGQVIPQTVGKIHKGQTFGEQALLGGALRDATIESVGEVKLLVIRAEEFLSLTSDGDEDDEPEHIRFCRQLDFLKEWPVDELVENSEHCMFNYYRRGAVIIKDSTDTEYIYIVKSGTCQVLKELREVSPRLSRDAKRGLDFHFPRLGTIEPGPKVDCHRTRQKRELAMPADVFRAMSDFHDSQEETNDYQDSTGVSKPEEEEVVKSPETDQSEQPEDTSDSEDAQSPGFTHGTFNLKPAFLKAKRDVGKLSSRSERLFSDRSTTDSTSGKIKQVYVQVEKLRPRDVFGLQYVKFSDDLILPNTKLSVVSNGAELILLDRKFFIQHANEHVKRFIRQSVRPYPGDDTLQENLQTATQWDSFKNNVISDTLLSQRGLRDFRLST